MTSIIQKMRSTYKGAALVEYGILVGLIAVLAIGSVLALGEEIESTFDTVQSTLSSNLDEATSGSETGATEVASNVVNSFSFTAVTMVGPEVHGTCPNSTACGTAYGSYPAMSGAGSLVVIGASHHGGNDATGVVFQGLDSIPFDMEVSCNGTAIGNWTSGTTPQNSIDGTYHWYNASSAIDPFDAGDDVICEIRDIS